MPVLHAAVLGVIQGITEFLPISSSGHLIFLPKLFGWEDQGLLFDIVMHMGTLLAVVVYFRKILWELLISLFSRQLRKKEQKRYGWMILLSIIPAGIVGVLWGDSIESAFRSPHYIAYGLIGWGLLLGIADWYGKHQARKESITWGKTFFIACAQAVALIPGTSRSGITMTAGLFSSLGKKKAAEFSFLMSVPVIAAAGGINILEYIQSGDKSLELLPITVGFFAAVVSGFIAIGFLLKIIQKWSFTPFVVYRLLIGVGLLLFII